MDGGAQMTGRQQIICPLCDRDRRCSDGRGCYDMKFSRIFETITIAGVNVPNRVVRTAHATRIGGGTMNDDLIVKLRGRG
jgi:hypothetical protein